MRQVLGNFQILLQLFHALDDNHLGLTVFTNVLTRGRIVGGVDAGWNAAHRNRTKVGKEPFGGIETNNIDHVEFRTPDSEQRHTERVYLLAVLLPCPRLPRGTGIDLVALGSAQPQSMKYVITAD
jgi:hypothetical protein